MSERTIQTFKKSLKRVYPTIPDEEIEKTIRKSFEEAKKHKPIILEFYSQNTVIEYLMKVEGMEGDEAKKYVSSAFNDFDSIVKEEGCKPLSEEEKAKFTIAIIGASKDFAEKTKEELNKN
jgi:hypothetical protein